MSFAYGYNIEKAKTLISDLHVKHHGFHTKIVNTWEDVETVITNEWVGVDRDSYVRTLCKRVNDLYAATEELVYASRVTITNLVNSWIEFQEKNVLEGGVTVEARFSRLEEPRKFSTGEPARPKWRTSEEENQNLGLQNTNSASKIKDAVTTFVNEIKSYAEEIIDELDISSALFGDQGSSLKSYIESVMKAVADIITAIKDLNDALDTLANTNYSTADADVSTQLTQETSNVSSQVDQTVTTRWV